MKKFISWLLALTMMMSTVVAVSADGTDTDEAATETTVLDAYSELTANKAVNLGNAPYNSGNYYQFANGNQRMVVYKNVDFGTMGSKTMNLFMGFGGDDVSMDIYLVRPENDTYTNAAGEKNDGVTVNGTGILVNGTRQGGTMYYTFSSTNTQNYNTGWDKNTYEINLSDMNSGTGKYGDKPLTGKYNVYIGFSYGNFYGIQFIERTNNAYEKLSMSDAVALNGTISNGKLPCSNGARLAVYRNVDFGDGLGAKALTLYTYGEDTDNNRNLNMYFVKADSDPYLNIETNTLNEGYTVSGNKLQKIIQNGNENSTSDIGGTLWYDLKLTKSDWSTEVETTFNLTDANSGTNKFNKKLTGLYNVYVGLNWTDFSGIKFTEWTQEEYEASIAKDVLSTTFNTSNFHSKSYTNNPSSGANFGGWANDNLSDPWAMWYVNFGDTAKAKYVDIYYGVPQYYANSYVTLYADERTEENIVAQGILTYKDGMDWGYKNENDYITLPVKKELTGIHKLYLQVAKSPYTTSKEGVGDITRFAFKESITGYKQTGDVYGNALNCTLLFDKQTDNDKLLYVAAVYDSENRLAGVKAESFIQADGVNYKTLSVPFTDLAAGTYTARGFVWNADTLKPLSSESFASFTIAETAE